MRQNNITGEIRKLITDKIANNETVEVSWLTHEVIQRHCDIDGDDKSFYLVCAYAHVKDRVRQCIGKYGVKQMTDRQLVLDGFSHLQVAYTVEREAGTVLVPVDQLADAELLARAREYDDMAVGCRDHAREIRKYVEARTAAEAA